MEFGVAAFGMYTSRLAPSCKRGAINPASIWPSPRRVLAASVERQHDAPHEPLNAQIFVQWVCFTRPYGNDDPTNSSQ